MGDDEDYGMKIASFMEVTGGDDSAALQMLEATKWNLEEALQLFFASGGAIEGGAAEASNHASVRFGEGEGGGQATAAAASAAAAPSGMHGEDEVRAPIPVRREALYDAPYGYASSSMSPATSMGGASLGLSSAAAAASGSRRASSLRAQAELMMLQQQQQHQQQLQQQQQQQRHQIRQPNPFAAPVPPHAPPAVDAFRNFAEEAEERARLVAAHRVDADDEDEAGGVGVGGSGRRRGDKGLATMYRPPLDLLFQGGFEEAKTQALAKGRWLIVNVQSGSEFGSHLMNRDTWSDETLKGIVAGYFVLWQVDCGSLEGRKICTYYKIESIPPVTMVLDPRTGQRKKAWEGHVPAEKLLEDLMPYVDRGPLEGSLPSSSSAPPPSKKLRDHHNGDTPAAHFGGGSSSSSGAVAAVAAASDLHDSDLLDEDEQLRLALAASLEPAEPSAAEPSGLADAPGAAVEAGSEGVAAPSEETKTAGSSGAAEEAAREPQLQQEMPALPEEPAAGAPGSCRVAIRCPDGKRLQRRFMDSDPVMALRAYCASQLTEAAQGQQFCLTPTVPGSQPLDLASSQSLRESGVANSMLALQWQ